VTVKIFKVTIGFSDSVDLGICEAIEYQGRIWLVPYWVTNPATGAKSPVRLIHLGKDGLEPTPYSNLSHYQAAWNRLPKAVFDGRMPALLPLEVLESPCIEIPALPPHLN
jgi:hypothetical protein